MVDESNKSESNQQPAERQEDVQLPVSLAREDILSDDGLHLSAIPQQVLPSESDNTVPATGSVLQFDELLSSIDSQPSMTGGFLMFDSDSSPGQTIVRVMLDDCGSHQAFEVGVFNGVGVDLNSLLGMIPSHDGDHS